MRRWTLLVLLSLYCTTTSAQTPHENRRDGWAVWVTGSLARVQPRDPPGRVRAAHIHAARNEYEAFQLVIGAPAGSDLAHISVAASDLTGPATISSRHVSLFRAHYVPVAARSQFQGSGSPHPPGEWADALIPFDLPGGQYPSAPFTVPAGRNQPLWVEVYVPKETGPGTYTGNLIVTAKDGPLITVPMKLTVWGFTLPDRPALASDFGTYDTWFSLAARRVPGAQQPRLRANLYAALDAHRLGTGEADLSDPALERWMATHRFIRVPSKQPDAVQRTIKRHFDFRGWGSFLGHYLLDEPTTREDFNEVRRLASRWRALGIPTMTTIKIKTAWAALDGAIDIWIPVFYECAYRSREVRTRLAKGERVWSYTAGVQPDGIPTWLLDYDLIHFRIAAWLNYRHGQTGLLYWTTAYWDGYDPWTNPTGNRYGNGDGSLFYPGDRVGAPNAAIPSARLKAIRDGIEDYDYLALLAELGDPALAHRLAVTLASAWNSWSRDTARLAAAREQAALRIVQLQAR